MRTENYVYLISAVRNLTFKVRKIIWYVYVYFTAAEMYINIYKATNKGTFIAIIQFNWGKKNLYSARELWLKQQQHIWLGFLYYRAIIIKTNPILYVHSIKGWNKAHVCHQFEYVNKKNKKGSKQNQYYVVRKVFKY